MEIYSRTLPLRLTLNRSGVFADRHIAALDGVTDIDGGWLNGHWIQVPYQLCNCLVGIFYSFFMTSLILWTMNISGLTLRVTEEQEERGIDDTEIGYFAYDYVTTDSEIRIIDRADDSIRSRNSLLNLYDW